MTKQSGLGDNFYIDGYDLSGDVNSLSGISTPIAVLDRTGIDKLAIERVHGRKDGALSFNVFLNDATDQEHDALKGMTTSDRIVTYAVADTTGAQAVGNPAAVMVAKQIGYDPTEGNDGSLTFAVAAQANAYGLEWGRSLTAGKRTDTTATSPATGYDTSASASFGGQAYLQVFSFSGTSVTVKIQDSADNSSFADISPSLVFTAATGRTSQRISVVNTTTIRRYVRVITTGTFTSAVFNVVLVKNETAGVVF